MDILLEASDKMKYSQNRAIYFEISMIKSFRKLNIKETSQKIIELEPDLRKTEVKPMTMKNTTNKVVLEPISKVKEEIKVEIGEKHNVSHETITTVKEEKSHKNSNNSIKEDVDVQILSKNRIVELMVSADKEKRFEDQEKLSYMNTYKHNIKWAKVVRMFERAELVLSSQYFMVFAFNDESSARESMVEQNKTESILFMKEITKEKRIVFSTTKREFQEAIQIFIEKTETGNLPNKIPSTEFIINENQSVNRDPILESAKELFGDKLEIKE